MLKHRLAVSTVAALAAVVITAGLAYAAWSAFGSGQGGAAATIAQGLTVTAVTPTGAAATLYPGGPASAVYFTITNPNPYAVTITGISWGTPVSFNTTSCPSANFSVSTSAPTTVSITVPPGAPTGAFSEPGVILMAHSAPDGCQGVGVGIAMQITGVEQ